MALPGIDASFYNSCQLSLAFPFFPSNNFYNFYVAPLFFFVLLINYPVSQCQGLLGRPPQSDILSYFTTAITDSRAAGVRIVSHSDFPEKTDFFAEGCSLESLDCIASDRRGVMYSYWFNFFSGG